MATLQLVSNPSRRKRRKARKSKRRMRRNPASVVRATKRRRRRSRRSSPKRSRRFGARRSRGFSIGGRGLIATATATVKTAGVAAAGAVLLDVVWAYLPLPDTLRAGPIRHVAKAAGAVALGMVAGRVLGKATGDLVATGAMTVVLANVIKEAVGTFAPQLRLAGLADEYPELAYINPAAIQNDSLNEYQAMGEYQPDFNSANL